MAVGVADSEDKVVVGDKATEAVTAVATAKAATAVGTTVTEDTITTAAVTAVMEVMITPDMVVIILSSLSHSRDYSKSNLNLSNVPG